MNIRTIYAYAAMDGFATGCRAAGRVWCDGDHRLGDGVDVHCSGGGSRAPVCIMGQLEIFLPVFF